MANITRIRDKQVEKLKDKTLEEKALAAVRRLKEELRTCKELKEPDQLASGKSDKNGQMITEDLDLNEDKDVQAFLKNDDK